MSANADLLRQCNTSAAVRVVGLVGSRRPGSYTGLILGTPEYHGGYSGMLKNALDSMRVAEFEGRVENAKALISNGPTQGTGPSMKWS